MDVVKDCGCLNQNTGKGDGMCVYRTYKLNNLFSDGRAPSNVDAPNDTSKLNNKGQEVISSYLIQPEAK